MIRSWILVMSIVLAACGGAATPNTPTPASASPARTIVPLALTPASSQPLELQWTKAPAAYPPGADISVLEGDTTKPGPYTLRLRFPDGYTLPPHAHPNDEHLTVIQGTFVIGMGRSAIREAAKELPVGSFLLIPNRTDHYAWANGETIVQLHGVGPGGLLYVNPADDPRNK